MREIALKIKSHATPRQFISRVGLQSYLYNSLFNAYITSFFPISGNSWTTKLLPYPKSIDQCRQLKDKNWNKHKCDTQNTKFFYCGMHDRSNWPHCPLWTSLKKVKVHIDKKDDSKAYQINYCFGSHKSKLQVYL